MKKILLSAVLAASGLVLFAQEDTTNRTNNTTTNQQMNTSTNQNTPSTQMSTTTTTNYNAYAVPNYVQMNVQAQHPSASNLVWDRSTADWYHGYYSDAKGRYTHVYYSTDPYYNVQYYPERITGYIVSLPVLQTWVPDEVVTTALNQYKHSLYDIAAMKGNNNTDMYVVHVLDNGELKSMYMDASGTAVTDYIRIEEEVKVNNTTDINTSTSTDANAAMDANSSMNSDMNKTSTDVKTKTKTKNSDGTETKTKTKDGKTKTKTSASPTNPIDQF